MYTIDGADRVTGCVDAPSPDTGAPLPVLLADERRLLLAYMVSDPEKSQGPARLMTQDTRGLVALVEFNRPRVHMFGPPDDETFRSHPLADRGLGPYEVFEVLDSSWIRQLARMNKQSPQWSPYDGMHHFIFAFHDSTFECIAKSLVVNLREGTVRDVMFEMMQRFQGA
jgi:hypothetical protein